MLVINIVLGVLLVILIGYLIYSTYHDNVQEHFVEDPIYKQRLNVMKIFDSVLHRKPSPDEIEKFANISNEQDMLEQIISSQSDTNNVSEKKDDVKLVEDIEKPEKNFKTFSLDEVNSLIKKIDDLVNQANDFKKQLSL